MSASSCSRLRTRRSASPGQVTIQGVGKGLLFRLPHGRWSTALDPAAAHGIHEVPHIQALSNGFRGVGDTPGAECFGPLLDDLCSQGDILRNHQVAGLNLSGDFVVRNIETVRNLPEPDVR